MELGKLDNCVEKNEVGILSYTIHKKINSKWIEDLNVRPETVTSPRRKCREKHHDIGLGNDILAMTPKAQATKAK